jgi:branched-chain amino acid transport system substrate-binding protein
MNRIAAACAATLLAGAAQAAEPVRIGITTILSGPFADRGQSEQYGAQLALDQVNEAGGVLGRPVEAYYADNACDPKVGVPATERLLQQEHVPVVIGALCTPVTHAIMPVMQAAKVPLIIATSAGQDFVDASGVGGNAFAWKTIPSETDIARGLLDYLAKQDVDKLAIVADDNGFSRANAVGFARIAGEMAIHVVTTVIVPAKTTDFAPIVAQLKAAEPEQVLSLLGPSSAGFYKALAASGWSVPVTGRIDLPAAMAALPADTLTSVAVFTPLSPLPGVQAFVASYRAHTGLMPTQRSFFVYEAVLLAVDAIRRAGSDTPEAIEAALKTTTMPSLLGGTYKMDDHNHPHTPLSILGVKDGKPAVIATE